MPGTPGTESDEHEVQQQNWPGSGGYPPPANRAPGNVYPSSGAPSQHGPEHGQPPAIPPPDEEGELAEDDADGEEPEAPEAEPEDKTSYGTWARRERASAGTVYGGKDGASPLPLPSTGGGSPLENTGSLTGHILSQGTAESDDDEEPRKSGNGRVFLIIGVMVVVLLVGGYFAVTLAHNFIDGVFGGVSTPK
ncbi:hypothetical protein ACQP00_00825 [Dactylosporangium sp. CS-047395]|uniref:hypothetical protein n=1 Tax=Dactylosporangium sp. CS-047395 TaxID=3239936 RepID=UPI003D89BD0C